MTEQAFLHKTYLISLLADQLPEGGWVPKAIVNTPTDAARKGHLVKGDPARPLPTKDAADAVAKKMAIEWIDLQFPSAGD